VILAVPLLVAAATTMPAKPPIAHDPIPFGARRKAEMRRYARRHYGLDTSELRDPRVIVIHYTDNDSFQATFNTFAPDHPDPELHELPNVCSHFVIDRSGTIHQLVPLGLMCRHTVGLNWTAFGIEHVGRSDQQVLGNHSELQSSLRLVRWLQVRYGITTDNVIGHNESLTSPFHRERVRALQHQTHGDFVKRDMDVYRAKLRKLGG
jgi:N-acetylmuramoyl-L-alanine amidase